MFQAQVSVVGITTTPNGTAYTVDVNGELFSFWNTDRLRIGIQIVNGSMVPVEMPIIDPGQPDLFVAFQMDGAAAQKMADEGITVRYMANPVPRPPCSVS